MSVLDVHFQALAEIMAAESRVLGKVYRAHHGKLGENREALLQRFFSTYLPDRFGVSTGFALLGADNLSTQQDVVIYDRLNNPVLFPGSAAPLFPPSALAAVVEVKSTLTRTELRASVKKNVALKRGVREAFANHPMPPRIEALGCLFAFNSRGDLSGWLDCLADEELKLGADPRDRFDLVCLLGKGLLLGGGVHYLTTTNGQPLVPGAPPVRQEWLALQTDHELLAFYSKILDYILGREDIRPQLMSYMPPDFPLAVVAAVR